MIEIIRNDPERIKKVLSRSQLEDENVFNAVKDIIANIKERGDEALFEYAKKFDNQDIDSDSILVTQEEIDDAYKCVDKKLIQSIKKAKTNILSYHKKQIKRFANAFCTAGVNSTSTLGWIYRPMSRVGMYVPGGKASYPSTVLMAVLPAVAAGVEEIIVCTPNINNKLILVACNECGIKKIYKVGGAQAIGAMTYGTESLPKVDLIAGPGNIYVTVAKKLCFGNVAIDSIAGPSEILVIADDSADPKNVAADLLSQAEHDELAASILVTTSERIAVEVKLELERQTKLLSRKDIIDKSLENNGAIIFVESIDEAIDIANSVAPEHIEICTKNAKEDCKRIVNAGAIFVGNYSPEPLGDYFAGPSHVLPTSGNARFASVLSVDTFMKKISYIEYSKEDLLAVADDIVRIAESEGFDGHANAVKVRKD